MGGRYGVVFLVVCLVALIAAQDQTAHTYEKLSISTGGFYLFSLENHPLLNWRFLWSSREITVLAADTETLYEIYYSQDASALHHKLQAHTSDATDHATVHKVDCSHESKLARTGCSFQLSYYGVNEQWWVPRVEAFLKPPAPTQVAIAIPDGTLFGSTAEKTITLSAVDRTPWKICLAVLVASVTVFLLADALSRSVGFYLTMWFLLGAFLSVFAILIAALYVGVSVSPRLTSVAGVVSMLLAVGWGSFYYSYVVNLVAHPEQHQIWVILILIGGVLSLLYGYQDKLEPEQMVRISFFVRLFALAMLFFSFSQMESAVLIVIGLAMLLPVVVQVFSLDSLRWEHLSSWGGRRPKSETLLAKSPSGPISMEEYVQEGIALTRSGVDDLVCTYQENPRLLQSLTGKARRRTMRLLEDHRRKQRRGDRPASGQ